MSSTRASLMRQEYHWRMSRVILELRALQNFGQRGVLQHRHDRELHEIAPQQCELGERLRILGLDQIVAPVEIGARPAAEELRALWGQAAGLSEARDGFCARFGVRLPFERQHEFHRMS